MHRLTCFFSAFLLLVVITDDAYAQTSRPLQVDDTWRYRQTTERLGAAPFSVSAPDFSIVFQNKDGAPVLAMKRHDIANAVWKLIGPISPTVCMFDVIAHEGVMKRCDMSLKGGDTWSTDETTSVARTQERFEIGTFEDVIVPAGKYKALRFQVERTITEVAYPGVPEPEGGYVKRSRTTYWYADEVKAMVKVVREFILPDQRVNRQTEELESFSQRTLKQ